MREIVLVIDPVLDTWHHFHRSLSCSHLWWPQLSELDRSRRGTVMLQILAVPDGITRFGGFLIFNKIDHNRARQLAPVLIEQDFLHPGVLFRTVTSRLQHLQSLRKFSQ